MNAHPMLTPTRLCQWSVAILSSLLLLGCGATRIAESHIVQSRDAKGKISYYRIKIDGNAKLAKTTYRAGLYDATALDALMNELTSEDKNTVEKELERQRREAVSKLASSYYDSLASTNSTKEQLEEQARRLGKAMLSPYDLVAAATPEGQPKPERKFAIIFSANASIVEEAIADFVEARETQDTVNAAVAGIKREGFIKASVEKERMERLRRVLKAVSVDANAMTIPAGGVDQQFVDAVKRLLNDVATLPNN